MRKLLIPVGVLFAAHEALACGVCVMAIADSIFPPAFLWFWLSLSWFLTSAIATAASRVPFGPSLGVAALWTFGCFFLGGAFFGPFATVPLGVVAAVVWFRTVTSDVHRRKYAVVAVGVAHLSFFIAGSAYGIQVLSHRSTAQYVCQWPGTGPGRAKFRELAVLGEKAAPSYRFIIANGRGFLVVEAAEELARIGDRRDIMLLESLRPAMHTDDERKRLTSAIYELRARNGV